MNAEPVILTKILTIAGFRNAVAVVATALLPIAVFGLPISGAMLLPNSPLPSRLDSLPLM